jgi:hypothetical protein
MALVSLTLKVQIAWWVKPAISCIALFCRFARHQPDLDRVCALLMHGVRVKVC